MQLLPYFACGALVRTARQEQLFDVRAAAVSVAAVTIVPAGSEPAAILAYVVIPIFTFAVAFGPRIVSLRGFDISYGVYLWSFPISQVLVAAKYATSPWANSIVTLLVVVPIAMTSWVFVERPALRLKPYVARHRP
jgi:peptidoglycan/LPS O-acetylase OafA/YrhL